MICREHQEFFSDLYDGNLPADRRRDLEAHLAACADCRAEYEEFSESLHALREAAARVPGETFVRRIVETAKTETERMALFQNTGLRRPTTRRMTAPRRPLWTIPALAASALVAFALGFMVQKQAADKDIQDLQDQITKNEVRGKLLQPPDTNALVRTNKEIIDLFLKENGIVHENGVWMSAALKERLNKGEMLVDGKWVNAKQEMDRRIAEELAKVPGNPDPKAAADRVFEKYDLVKHGDWIIPRRWAEALNSGMVLNREGDARDLSEIVAEKFRELGLVEHDGQWMRPEEKTELLAANRIRSGFAPASAVTSAFDGLEIGPPLGFKNLMLYPLIATGERTLAVTTLPEAVAADRVEIWDEVNALQVRVKNKGEGDLALFSGEILLGGRHARVVARDTIVPGKNVRVVEVFDVEPAELRAVTVSAFRRDSAHYWAPLGMRRLLNEEAGQAGIWASVMGPGGRVATADLYRDHRAALFEFRSALIELRSDHPGMVGVAVAVGDSIASAEVFGTPALFAAHFDRILESAAIEAIVTLQGDTRFPSDLPAGALSVKRLVESAFSAEQVVEGDTILVRRNGGRILGRALTAGGEAVRVILFPDGPAVARPALDLAIAPAKVQHVLKAYEARLQGTNGPRRVATLREMAMLPGDRARDAVLAQAKPGMPHRRDAVEALGLRGDPTSGETLLQWLKDSRRDIPMYSALALALARIGSEDAVQALIADIDPRSPQLARAAAEHLPALMASLREVNSLERAMESLIAALNRVPLEPNSEPQRSAWQLKTLRQVTGKSFVGTLDYTHWWNDEAQRANFLEHRRRGRD